MVTGMAAAVVLALSLGTAVSYLKYLEAEHGPALDTMRLLKRALDPDNRMNPGKMVLP